MRIRALALALALVCGAPTMVQAAFKKPVVQKAKVKKFKPKKYKQSKAAHVKPRKAPKHK
jgi:hypothetical protein